MYESYYGLSANPFQLKPDPAFFFGSKAHKRAMSYLEYGVSQGEGFIVITGEVGAGKTTLVRNLYRMLPTAQFEFAQIVNTRVDSLDALRMVVSAFGLPCDDSSKATLLGKLERFLRHCDHHGKRALLVVDEAQNLTPATLEELRMLSNLQNGDQPLLQTFLLGQPEFRGTLHRPELQQLRQRVIAAYHLGPMDEQETQAYIMHRLRTVGWQGDPSLSNAATIAIHNYAAGIPRKINTFCHRLFVMGCLEDIHAFDEEHVRAVIKDIDEEFTPACAAACSDTILPHDDPAALERLARLDERLSRTEKSMVAMLDAIRRMLSSSRV